MLLFFEHEWIELLSLERETCQSTVYLWPIPSLTGRNSPHSVNNKKAPTNSAAISVAEFCLRHFHLWPRTELKSTQQTVFWRPNLNHGTCGGLQISGGHNVMTFVNAVCPHYRHTKSWWLEPFFLKVVAMLYSRWLFWSNFIFVSFSLIPTLFFIWMPLIFFILLVSILPVFNFLFPAFCRRFLLSIPPPHLFPSLFLPRALSLSRSTAW